MKIEAAEAKATALAEAETQPGDLPAEPMDAHIIKMEIDQDPYQLHDQDPYQLDDQDPYQLDDQDPYQLVGGSDDPPLNQHDFVFQLTIAYALCCSAIFLIGNPQVLTGVKSGLPLKNDNLLYT